ncbi:MAG TPA: kelch repeat-containing protein [Chryseolinea sp.]
MFLKILSGLTRTILILLFGTSLLYAQFSSADLTVPRKNLAATSVGNKALFAGGNNQKNVNFTTVDIYDYLTGQWTTHVLSQFRHALGATSFGTKAFFAAGVGPGLLATVDVYDDSKATNQWSSFSLATPRAHIGIAAAGGKVFFGGGQVSCNYCFTTNVEVYDINAGQFVSSIAMRVARGYLSAVAVGTKVFFVGGLDVNGAYVDDVDIYDTSTNTWTYTDLPSGGRSHLTAVANGNKVFFAGGRHGTANGYTNAVDIYDVVTGNWETSKTLSQARGYLHSASIGDKVFFGGGYWGPVNQPCDLDNPNDPNLPEQVAKTSEVLDIYDVTTGQMLSPLTLPGGKRFALAATRAGESKVVFAGGAGPCNEASAAVDIYDIDPLVEITGTSFPEELSTGDKIGITVDDVSKVSSVKAYIRGVSDPDGEFDAVASTGNASSFENTPDLSDEIGIVYFFEITDKYGRIRRSDTATSYNHYPAGSPRLEISGLRHGDTESAYQIISVPLHLDEKTVLSVFGDELGEYNIKKWRLYDFKDNENREYPVFNDIVPGKGYWLITREAVSLSAGAGSTARKTRGEEFEITLPSGWSLIGNPYNFKISWTDIKDNNPGFSESQKIKVFSNGTLEETLVIDKYRGAFAYNSNGAPVTLKIPVKRNTTLSGRVAAEEEIDLDAPNWQLLLELTDGSFRNRLGGIGMNKMATLSGLDEFDGLSVPMIEGIGMPGLIFSHPETKMNFSREVVPTQVDYTWDMEIQRGSDKTLTLQWSNEHFKESQKQLFLYDPSTMHMVDMKSKSSYILPPSASNLQVMMGGSEFMNKKRDELMPLFGNPYPNPAADKVNIPFWIPAAEGEMQISVKVYNMLGAEVKSIAPSTYQSGGHELVLNMDGPSGIYLVHMKANNRHNKWTKVTVR